MNLEKQSYALGVYCYPKTVPSPKQYEEIYNCFIDLLEEIGVKPNYIGVDGGYASRVTGDTQHNDIMVGNRSGKTLKGGETRHDPRRGHRRRCPAAQPIAYTKPERRG